MRASTHLAGVAVLLARLCSADFQIYSAATANPYMALESFAFFPSEPNCDMANNRAIMVSPTDDASGGGVRCEGCDSGLAVADWDVIELEIHDEAWGHFTLYKDLGYLLEPANGGYTRGFCVRNSGDDYVCPNTFSNSGVRLFICDTDLIAPFYKH